MDLGRDVLCVDLMQGTIAMLERDEVPIWEPGSEAVLSRNVAAERSQAFLRVGRQSGEPTYGADDPVALYRDAFMSAKVSRRMVPGAQSVR